MKINFLINDYNLIWNVLFQASITEKVHAMKQKLWNNYKDAYSKAYGDNKEIIADYKNFIPNDDTIYNMVIRNEVYLNVKRQTEKYRIELLNLWDENKKEVNKILREILRIDISDVDVLVVNSHIDNMDLSGLEKGNTIVWSKKIDKSDKAKSLAILIYSIASKITLKYKGDDLLIARSVLELALLNELPTRIGKKSYYLMGSTNLQTIKRQIYPYFLMYLGVSKEEMTEYMERDKIAFDTFKYTSERQLKKVDINRFIKFCISNKKYIMRMKLLDTF